MLVTLEETKIRKEKNLKQTNTGQTTMIRKQCHILRSTIM